ncbi:MAG: glycosyltransferase family 2 protein, partial [Candidatus Omnitrophica bacterium]|nr:glycosyltransferase family 2 protein [Candidatus Omnitrophota bacterium]
MTTQAAYGMIVYPIFLIFFGYFIVLTLYYLFLALIGLAETGRRALENEAENYPLFYFSSFAIPVSIVIPAHNEKEWIRDCLLSVLNLNYPIFEVIVVDDGSTDSTPVILNDMFKLFPIDTLYTKHYKDGKVESIFKSELYPNVTVMRKSASSMKKAGTVNAGLNIAKYEYVCALDADTVLEQDALLKVMAQVQKDPEHIIGIGSYFGL